jgi:signal peptidase II
MMPRLGLGVALAAIVLDQVTKAVLIGYLSGQAGPVVLGPFLDLVMVWNRGVSFGLFNSAAAGDIQRWLLIVLSLGIVALLGAWLWSERDRLLAAALGLIIGGALGNVIDRLRFGAVADFFYFHVGAYYWPAFNVADSAIVLGVGALLYDSLFRRPKGG